MGYYDDRYEDLIREMREEDEREEYEEMRIREREEYEKMRREEDEREEYYDYSGGISIRIPAIKVKTDITKEYNDITNTYICKHELRCFINTDNGEQECYIDKKRISKNYDTNTGICECTYDINVFVPNGINTSEVGLSGGTISICNINNKI